MITIVDYNMGNLGSIRNMLKKVGVAAEITADRDRIAQADQIILPGVGAFDPGMDYLERSGLIPVLEQRILRERVPVLGICLGMQLMTRGSIEGTRAGLGWIDADTLKFDPSTGIKVPHMGWNRVEVERRVALLEDLPEEPRFYFVHSYYVRCRSREDVILSTEYGLSFDSGVRRDNIWGVQFHPEKSHTFGMRLLRNFAARCLPC